MRSELMSAIYDKALKRKDFSGIVDKDAAKDAKNPGKPSQSSRPVIFGTCELNCGVDTDPKADDPKAGADIGKIVNLMAGDANRVRSLHRSLSRPLSCTSLTFAFDSAL